jgi:putative ABC transport system permease protein
MDSHIQGLLERWLDPKGLSVVAGVLVILCVLVAKRKALSFIIKSLSRNKVRTILTGISTFMLVMIITFIWTVLHMLDLMTAEKTKDLKVLVTEKWSARGQMPYSYARDMEDGGARRPGDVKPQDSMAWAFYIGTLDASKLTRENFAFFFCMDPTKFPTMMDSLEDFTLAEMAELHNSIKLMKADKSRIMLGVERMKALNKTVGERIKLTSLNYKDIDLELEICGTLPKGRYGQAGVMNLDYLQDALDAYSRTHKGEKHPMADKVLSLMFLRTEDMGSFQLLAGQIASSGLFNNPPVKVETASSGVASFLDAYRDLLWGLRWLLVPAILATMSLVIANAISISVRERRTEMAVLKVLGFTPGQILGLVLGEALLVGMAGGTLSSWLAYIVINGIYGGLPFQLAWIPVFRIPVNALWWGPLVGGATALAGSILPALTARNVKVSEVFAKVG